MPTPDRVLPHSAEIEQQVLGAMMLSAKAISQVTALIGPEAFYRERHRHIYHAIRRLYDRGAPVDLSSLGDELERQGHQDIAADAGYLIDIAASVGTSGPAIHHARLLLEKQHRRQAIAIAGRLAADCYDPSGEADEMLEAAELALTKIRSTNGRGTLVDSLGDIVAADFAAFQRGESTHRTIPTGFPWPHQDGGPTLLDRALGGGLYTQELYVIGSRPGQGKTSMGVQMAYTAAMARKGTRVGYINLEGGRRALSGVAMAQVARVSPRVFMSPRDRPDDQHIATMEEVVRWLKELPIAVDDMVYDRPATLGKIRSHAKMLRVEHGVNLLILDYLSKIEYDRRSYQEDLGRVIDGLVDIAIVHDMAVLLFHHLNRRYGERVLETGEPLRPEMADFGLTGSLERYAAAVFAICNPHAGVEKPKSLVERNPENGVALMDWGDPVLRVELLNMKNKWGLDRWSVPYEWVGHHRLYRAYPKRQMDAEQADLPF